MLLKFAFHDFLDDRRFKNTTTTNIWDKAVTINTKLLGLGHF